MNKKTRTKGILTLESDKKILKKKNTLEKLKRKPKKKVDIEKKNSTNWKNIQNFHKDTEQTKEFSDIKLGGLTFLNKMTMEPTLEENKEKIEKLQNQEKVEQIKKSLDLDQPLKEKNKKKLTNPPVINKKKGKSQNLIKRPTNMDTYTSMQNMKPKSHKNSVIYTSHKNKKRKRRISRSTSRRKLDSSNDISPISTNDSPSTLKMITNLQKMAKNKLHTSTLEELNRKTKNEFPDFGAFNMRHDMKEDKCICKLCRNPRKSRSRSKSRRNSIRSKFDSRKSAEEIFEDKKKNRQRQNSRSVKKRKEPRFEDPYKKKNKKDRFGKHQDIFGGHFSPTKTNRIQRRGSGFLKKLNSETNLKFKSRFKKSKKVNSKVCQEIRVSPIYKMFLTSVYV
jgi:hypothetical protein